MYSLEVYACQFNIKDTKSFPYRIIEYGITGNPTGKGYVEGGHFKDDDLKDYWISDGDWLIKLPPNDNQPEMLLIFSNDERKTFMRLIE